MNKTVKNAARKPKKQAAPKKSGDFVIKSRHEEYKMYAKVNFYDTVFKLFFKVDENVRKLYESLTSRETRIEDIERITLEEGESFDSQLCNDLGFLVKNAQGKDEFVILTEAQSTWNEEMPYRFLEYAMATFHKYVSMRRHDKFKDHFRLPRPRFYLIYTGGEAPAEKLRFSETYETEETDCDDLDFGIKVMSSEGSDTVPGQYIGVCKLAADLRRNQRDHVQFVNELREECEKKRYGLFVKFIDDHKAEMECEMEQVFKSEQEYSDYMDERDKEKEKEVIKNITPEIRKQAIIELYDKKQISLENAASNLNMTVPEFEELLKQQRNSA